MEDVRQAVLNHSSTDVAVISQELTKQLGKFVSVGTVVQILSTANRGANVGKAKGKASETLDQKLTTMEHVSSKLLQTFNDPIVPLKDRIEAAKELRQWTKLGIDMSGIHDAESDTLFVIDAEWSSRPIN